MGRKKAEGSGAGMQTEQIMTRSIYFPRGLWDAIDADARKHKRSAIKQLEYLLSVYYETEAEGRPVPLAERIGIGVARSAPAADNPPGSKGSKKR